MSQTKFSNPLNSNPGQGSPMSPSSSGEASKGSAKTGSGAASTHGGAVKTDKEGRDSQESHISGKRAS